jgi:uncharacterized membrane protein
VGARLRSPQRNLLDSLWFTPTVIALVYATLALVLLRADQALGLDSQVRDAGAGGGADGARGVLFAIAGTTLSVLGVVFSLTIVDLQIASGQFRAGWSGRNDRGPHATRNCCTASSFHAMPAPGRSGATT